MNIYLTLDYELFMGLESGTVKNCLIKPMNRLIERTSEFGVLFTLFVDAAYLYRLSILKCQHATLQKDYDDIVLNLQWLAKIGHSIQLHIHPQWYFSTYEKGKWQIDQSHYKLSDIPYSDLNELFAKSKLLLEKIIGNRVTAFRAGGYSIQSLKNYTEFLAYNNIFVDSSAASGQEYKSNYQWYDYRNVKSGRIYRFSNDITKYDTEGKLIEYPISCIHISTIRYVIYRLYIKFLKNIGKPFGDGLAVPANRKLGLLDTRIINYSIDYVMAPMLFSSLTNISKSGQEDIVLIGHPKNQSEESIEELRNFIIKTKYLATYKTIK